MLILYIVIILIIMICDNNSKILIVSHIEPPEISVVF